jgi:spore maturation protein CgeB
MNRAKLKIFRALSGHPSARLQFEDGRQLHLHSTVRPEAESKYLAPITVWGEAVLLLGVGFGYHLAPYWAQLADGRPVILVDCFETFRSKGVERLGQGSASLCVGPESADGLDRIREHLEGKTVQVIRHPASCAADPEYYDRVERALLPPSSHGGKGQAIRRVMVLCGNFFFQDELGDAVEKSGRECVRFEYEAIPSEQRAARFQEVLARFRPDLVLTVGFKGCDAEGEILAICGRRGLPVGVWFVDDPRPNCLAFRKQIDSQIYAFCWERAYLPGLERWGFGGVCYLPLAACEGIFDGGNFPGSELGISFTGSAMGESFLADVRRRFMWDSSLAPEVELRARQVLSGQRDALSVLHENPPFPDEKNNTWFTSLVLHTASGLKRQATCRSLLGEGLVLVGDPEGWTAALGPGSRVLPHVDYSTQLGGIYQHSAININITSCQMPTAVNQRLFDAPLAGGFLVTDAQPDALALFQEGEELIIYRSVEELLEQCRFYLSRPASRARVVEGAQRRIRAEHCVRHRLERMVQFICEG